MALAMVASIALAGVGSGFVASSASASSSSGDITFALPPSTVPNYIFPIFSGAQDSIVNVYQMQQIMFRTLYYFGQGTSPAVNETLSLAQLPVFSDGGKTVTVTLKKYDWSDGVPVTARDVIFFINLLKSDQSDWADYVPGEFPSNVTSVTSPNSSTVVFHLNKAYSSTWFLYNELSQITPLPQQAWDKESASGAIGNYDETPAGAKLVFNYLTKEAETLSTYSSDPLWQTVDGPFKIKQYEPSGYSVYVPNEKYSGPSKAKYSELIEEPFTTDSAEFNSLRSGVLDYGYIPPQDASQIAVLKSSGYNVSPWVGWDINYFPINFNNPTVGPLFKQLYIRQVLQEMVNQPVAITKALYGYGTPTYGPVPVAPKNTFTSPQEATNPYPFSPKTAASQLKSHGWDVKAGGVTTCASAGTGSSQCGADIAKGAKLVFNLQYDSGVTYTAVQMEQYKSSLEQVGIQLNLTSAPFDTIITNAAPCNEGPTCTWEMENWGGGWTFGPDFEPTGETLFATDSGFNEGRYSDATNDANINATHVVSGISVFYKYENYLADQLPVIWQPAPDYQISAISSSVKGVTQSPEENFTPEDWTISK
ncbi:MAG: ABC transporter substrate-binding protein [Acidimicrobiales bacterium]